MNRILCLAGCKVSLQYAVSEESQIQRSMQDAVASRRSEGHIGG